MTIISERLASLYTPLEEAAAELRARQLSCSCDSNCPLVRLLIGQPCAVLFRFVATPNYELERFLFLANSIDVTPIVLEYHRDKFVSRSLMKYSLARLRFLDGFGRNGGPRLSSLTVTDMSAADGCSLEQVQTRWGQSLVGFHHELLNVRFPRTKIATFDASDWFTAHGPSAKQYYVDWLSLFISHGILFESFLPTPDEYQFTSEVVIPAFEEACSRYGRRPLICRLDPPETEGDPYWLQYPHALRKFVAARLASRDNDSHS